MTLDDEMFAVGLIHNGVPASDYLSEDHCLAHCREFGQPTMFDRQRAEESRVRLRVLGRPTVLQDAGAHGNASAGATARGRRTGHRTDYRLNPRNGQ